MSSTIKAIDKSTVHRICSGQVVLSLAIAVKELVENSLDASATVIEVKLKDYGSECVEVTDNGYGVHPDNFEGLTIKHATSKLREFSDLVGVETFGFRGEALSSLCALSNLTVSTRHSSQECGTTIVYDHHGNISEITQNARQVGTTVILNNLFSTLPVRHKEFNRNLKKEFNKMVQLLTSYCLVSTGVKITCINQTKGGTRTTFVSTQGCKSVKENIACIFGTKQLSSLLDVRDTLPSPEVLDELKVGAQDCSMFKLEGHISSCAHGQGRSANDRQFYYINSRPCEPTKVMKAVNEVYHQYNMHQNPFVYLNITVARESVDVNVTPDKRQVFLNQEKLLVALVKASLLSLYESIPSTFSYNNVPVKSSITSFIPEVPNSNRESKESPSVKAPSIGLFSKWRHKNDSKRSCEEDISPKATKIAKQDSFRSSFSHFQSKQRTLTDNWVTNASKVVSADVVENETVEVPEKHGSFESIDEKESVNISVEHEDSPSIMESNRHEWSSLKPDLQSQEVTFLTPPTSRDGEESGTCSQASSEVFSQSHNDPMDTEMEQGPNTLCTPESLPHEEDTTDTSIDGLTIEGNLMLSENEQVSKKECPLVVYDSLDITFIEGRKCVRIESSIDTVEKLFRRRLSMKNSSQGSLTEIKFKAAIEPSKNDQAEQELRKEISKDMFSKMEIIGQFNLGFIITKLGSDLFIVDQHATDEKYNFETMQKTTVISNQRLVLPQSLELTAANECVLLENLEVFKKNGFDFEIDKKASTTKRIKLTAIPISKGYIFGKEDVDELIFMLQDSPGVHCRPSRVRAMFASRACRKSVMIGTSLSKQQMKSLVEHMGQIEQPWNCPHGRPTMRHLVNLDLLK